MKVLNTLKSFLFIIVKTNSPVTIPINFAKNIISQKGKLEYGNSFQIIRSKT